MLSAILLASAALLPSDTIVAPGVVLLGTPIDVPTYERTEARAPVEVWTPGSLYVHASLPHPRRDVPGLPAHGVASQQLVGFSRAELEQAVATVEAERRRGAFPGAAIAIGRWEWTVVEQGIGTLDHTLGSPAVDPDHTLYDLASLTKVVATTLAVMLLVEDGRLKLDAPVSRYLPEFSGGEKDRVTIRHLLAHNSGLRAWADSQGATPQESLRRVLAAPLIASPGSRVEYSDAGFIVLWAAAERAHGAPLEQLLQRRVFGPLEMRLTGFRPGEACQRCAPTEDRPGYQGVVHDPIARRLGGVAGHAGLFSTLHDVARVAAMLANGGELAGVRVVQAATIRQFTQPQPGAGTRALGWDTPNRRGNGAAGVRISPSAFGHTGFTGTSLWVDPERGTWVVLLSNRTFRPSGPNRMQALRRELHDRVATAVDLVDDD